MLLLKVENFWSWTDAILVSLAILFQYLTIHKRVILLKAWHRGTWGHYEKTGQRIKKGRRGKIVTYVYWFMSAVFDPYSGFLDHIQVGSGHYKGSVSTRTKRKIKHGHLSSLNRKLTSSMFSTLTHRPAIKTCSFVKWWCEDKKLGRRWGLKMLLTSFIGCNQMRKHQRSRNPNDPN